MKSVLFKKIFFGIACLLMAVSGVVTSYAITFDKDSISKMTTTYTLGEENVKIDIYQREVGEPDDSPTFAIGDTIMKAIAYKKANLTEDVEINLAIYRIYHNTAAYYVPNTVDYGKMTNLSEDETKECIRISYAMVKAAQWGIETNFIFHVDNGKTIPYMNKFLNDVCFHDSSKKVKDYLKIRKCEWPTDVSTMSYQMHSKQFIVSDYLDHDGQEYHDAVWASSANIDQYTSFSKMPIDYKDWAHSGFMISNNSELYKQNELFFDITFENYNNRERFGEQVQTQKALGNLKYEDEHIEMYFTPMSRDYTDAWNIDDNPVAKYMERLANCKGEFALYINMYSFSEHSYTERVVECIERAFANNPDTNNIFSLTVNDGLGGRDDIALTLSQYGEIRFDIKTHAKDYIFYFGDTNEYVVITGSANLCEGEALWKSNQTAVFKEYGDVHPIFDTFVEYYNRCNASENAIDKLG